MSEEITISLTELDAKRNKHSELKKAKIKKFLKNSFDIRAFDLYIKGEDLIKIYIDLTHDDFKGIKPEGVQTFVEEYVNSADFVLNSKVDLDISTIQRPLDERDNYSLFIQLKIKPEFISEY